MADMIIKSTFTLDKNTIESIHSLSSDWKVSQAEVIRKSIRIAMQESIKNKSRSPLSILELMEKKQNPSKKKLDEYKKIIRLNRKGWEF